MDKQNPKSSPRTHSYRYDIDGLRAIAVMAVVIGHAFESVLPGGYLGVDVFFVISGFVITMSLLGKQNTDFGGFIGGFFLRRVKRLMPALLVCTALTSGALLVLDSNPKASLATGASALFGLANILLYVQELDYFSASVKYNAFTHMWSLGVEEQFYLLFPFIFLAVRRLRRGNTEGVFNGIISFLTVGSLLAFWVIHKNAPHGAYYMMPTRFWELGIGVLAAMFVHSGAVVPRFLSSMFSSTTLVFLLFAIFAISSNGEISGHIIAASLTTVLLIVGESSPKPVSMLCNPVSGYVGRISYSLYLWHWPFLVFGLVAPVSVIANPFVAIVCALCASVLSYHFVEQPVRKIPTPIVKFRYFVVTFGAIFGLIIFVGAAYEYRKLLEADTFPPAFNVLPESGLKFSRACVVNSRTSELQADTFSKCTFAPLPGGDQRTLWVLGDSHAGHLQGTFLRLRSEYGFGFHLIETAGVAYPVTKKGGFPPRDTIMQNIRRAWQPGDVVVLSRLFFDRKDRLETMADFSKWLALVDQLASELSREGIELLLVGPPPIFDFEDIRACDPLKKLNCGIERRQLAQGVERVHSMLRNTAEAHSNTRLFEVFSTLCPKVDPSCHPADNGAFLFRDRDHLNVKGAALLAPSMYETLNAGK